MTIDQINEIIARADGWERSPVAPRYWRPKGASNAIYTLLPTYHRAEDHGELLRVEREKLPNHGWAFGKFEADKTCARLYLEEKNLSGSDWYATAPDEDLARADCVAQALRAQQEKGDKA